jgi:hypothetical protein
LKCDKLCIDIENHIIDNLLTLENVVHFYELAIEFNLEKLNKTCLPGIV